MTREKTGFELVSYSKCYFLLGFVGLEYSPSKQNPNDLPQRCMFLIQQSLSSGKPTE